MTLEQELQSAEYDGKSYQEILEIVKNKSESVIGKIAYGNTFPWLYE